VARPRRDGRPRPLAHLRLPAGEFIFQQRLPRTLLLTITSLTIALIIAIPVGIFSAVRQYSAGDYTITFLSFVGLSTPNFFLGIILMYLFVIYLPETIGCAPCRSAASRT
jgi:peptide/nickel transport system permease protein